MRLDHLLSREKWKRPGKQAGREAREGGTEGGRRTDPNPRSNGREAESGADEGRQAEGSRTEDREIGREREGGRKTEKIRTDSNINSNSSLYRFKGPGRNGGHGGLAQLEERVLCKHEVIGSSPIFSTLWADSSVG